MSKWFRKIANLFKPWKPKGVYRLHHYGTENGVWHLEQHNQAGNRWERIESLNHNKLISKMIAKKIIQSRERVTTEKFIYY